MSEVGPLGKGMEAQEPKDTDHDPERKGEHVPNDREDVPHRDAGVDDSFTGTGCLVASDLCRAEALRTIEFLAKGDVLRIECDGAVERRHRRALVPIGGSPSA